MNYPLQLSFKVLAIARQISVTDSTGSLLFYVKQKAFKLKEAVTVFADAQQSVPLYNINADRIIDFSASYRFTDRSGAPIGSLKRQGMKSLWKARYDIANGGGTGLTIQEANPWIKVLDALFSEIPVVGLFSGYVFHPVYIVGRENAPPVLRLRKEPAFLESRFTVEKLGALSEKDEISVILSLIMLVLLERRRG